MNQQQIGQRQITTEKAPRKNKTSMTRNNKGNTNGLDSGWRAIPPLPRYESVHKKKI